MQKYLKQLQSQIQGIWDKMTKWQRISAISGTAVAFLLLTLLIISVNQTEYGVLFSNLSEQDAAVILNKLKDDKVPYQLANEGHTILVPMDQVYERRLVFAAEGLPQSGIIGYEIFDKNNIGLTDFVQKLNYKRALEGELARTIQSFDEIVSARVHIMVPEPSLFIEDENPATASIVVNLAPGKKLHTMQVEGIANLVAGSVEGLEPESVTVIDTNGKTLSDNREKNNLIEQTASQLELQQRVEHYLEEKLTSLLDGVVGPGNNLVRVTSELDFSQVERTMESYDPESSSIRSQQIDVQGSSEAAGDSGSTHNENKITNYEISKTLERLVKGVGSINRLSVAVMINGTYREATAPDGSQVLEYIPRSDEEIQKIYALVQNAIGYDPSRNDQIKVEHIRFDQTEKERTQQYLEETERTLFWNRMLQHGSIVLAALMLVFLIKSIFSKISPAVPELEEPPSEVEKIIIPAVTNARIQRRRMVNELVRERPDEISRLLKSWVISFEKN